MAGHGHDVQTSVEVFVVDYDGNVRNRVPSHQVLEDNMIPQPQQTENIPVPFLTSNETNLSTVNVSHAGSVEMGLQQSHAPSTNEIKVVVNTENILERGNEQDVELGGREAIGGSRKRKTPEQELGQSSESETQFEQSSRTSVTLSADDSSFMIMFEPNNLPDEALEEEQQNQRIRIAAENLLFSAYCDDYVDRDSENEVVNSGIRINHGNQGVESAFVTSGQIPEAPPMDLDTASTNLNGQSRLSVASFLPQSVHALIPPEAFTACIEDLINSIPPEDLQAATSGISFLVNRVVPPSGGSSEDASGNNTENLSNLTVESSIAPGNGTTTAEAGLTFGSHRSTAHLNHHQVRLLKLIHRYLLPHVLAQRGHAPASSLSGVRGSFYSNQSQTNQIETSNQSSGHVHLDPLPLYGSASFLDRDSDDEEENDFPPSIQTSWRSRARGAYGINEQLQYLYGQDYVRRRGSYRFESSRFYDRHRDMRLDVDNMSYEELLALEERIGFVSTGLNDEEKSKCVKLWTYACASSPKRDESEPCCICQEEFVDGNEMGSLLCSHDFHAECIKKWLNDKKICPYCRESAVDDKSQP